MKVGNLFTRGSFNKTAMCKATTGVCDEISYMVALIILDSANISILI